MSTALLAIAAVILSCLFLSRLSGKMGVPTLALFILLGMLCGSDGILKIPFEDFIMAERLSTVALIFIMFYGGFGTRWREARPVAVPAALLSSLGVALTAVLTGAFCYAVLGFTFWEGMLLGAVISSTDAASVFSILRSKKLNLKYGTASLLEVESGSNDPFSYMLTIIVLSIIHGGFDAAELPLMLAAQVLIGMGAGAAAGWITGKALASTRFRGEGAGAILALAMALLAYAGADKAGGNGYLSVYIFGIILGNQPLPHKKNLVNFFDSFTGLMQMLLFFTLGLLSFPSRLPDVLLPGLGIALFLTFIARPLAVTALMTPFRRPLAQQTLVAWAGLRGAASIAFAIMATVHPASTPNDVFHIVFVIVLFSIFTQGSLLPLTARKLNMIDNSTNVMKTFSDYSEEIPIDFVKISIAEGHPWAHARVKDIPLIPDLLLVMLLREGKRILPGGDTELLPGDLAVLAALSVENDEALLLTERAIDADDAWKDRSLKEIRPGAGMLVVAVLRGEALIIPRGGTVVRQGDVLIICETG